MAAVEIYALDVDRSESVATLRIVAPSVTDRYDGPTVAQRRASRALARTRRHRLALGAAVVLSLVLLAWPGHAFGGTNGVGLSTDLASSSTLSSGMVYVVQPGDSVSSIARLLNPVHPAQAEAALVAELRSHVVVAGEHVLIP